MVFFIWSTLNTLIIFVCLILGLIHKTLMMFTLLAWQPIFLNFWYSLRNFFKNRNLLTLLLFADWFSEDGNYITVEIVFLAEMPSFLKGIWVLIYFYSSLPAVTNIDTNLESEVELMLLLLCIKQVLHLSFVCFLPILFLF